MDIGFNPIDVSDGRGVKPVDLVTWTRSQLKNHAIGSSNKRGDDSRIFISNKTAGWDDGQYINSLKFMPEIHKGITLQLILSNLAEAASRICCGRPRAPRPSLRITCSKVSQCTEVVESSVYLWKLGAGYNY